MSGQFYGKKITGSPQTIDPATKCTKGKVTPGIPTTLSSYGTQRGNKEAG